MSDATRAGRDLRFILATTAGTVNLEHIETKQRSSLSRLCLPEIAKRVHFQVCTWPDLENLVRRTKTLKDLFVRPERIADKEPSHTANMLARRLPQYVECMELGKARLELDMHLAKVGKRDTPYAWAPSTLFDPLADLYLAAADFRAAAELFEVALGADPLNAKYMLGHLRARRVLCAAPRDSVVRSGLFSSPSPLPPLADEIKNMAPELLTALGNIDHQLTLALWVVSYANDIKLAAAGLRRALGLVAQDWPEDAERFVPTSLYAVTDRGFIARQPDPGTPWYRNAGGRILACALAAAYSYIRFVYRDRFGTPSMLAVEQAHGGWPDEIHGMSRGGLLTFFSNLHASCEAALRQYLPTLLAEGAGGNYDPPPSDDFIFRLRKPLDGSLYVATEDFLLRDCSERFVNRRVEELGQFGFMGGGGTILTSHHGLERLCQIRFSYALDLPRRARPDPLAHAMVFGIDKVLENLVRYESWPVFSTTPVPPPFASAPIYFDYPSQNYSGTRDASIELARWRGARFCAATVFEYGHAADELGAKAELVPYWEPLPANSAKTSQPAL